MNKINRLILSLGVAGLAGTSVVRAETALPPQGSMQGVWVWQSDYIETDARQDKMIAFFKKNGYNRMLLQIPWKNMSMASGKPEMILQPQLARLLGECAKAGIVVEALDGAPTMARKYHWATTMASLEAILAFNKTQPPGARFAGIHWDIEPYVHPTWKTDERADVMLEYLQFLGTAKSKLVAESPEMLLSVDIPMWYDNATTPGNNCVLEFNGQTKNFHEHIQDICDYIGIMSYRQHAVGRNSVTEHVASEIAYAEKIGKRVCPALETIELKETPQITFFGQSPEKFLSEKAKVEAELKDRAGYQGVLVHHYPSLRNLIEGTTDQP